MLSKIKTKLGNFKETARRSKYAHYYKDYDVPLLCTIRHPYGAESFDWIDGIIDNTMRIENGYAYPRETSGWGFTFKEEFLEKVD